VSHAGGCGGPDKKVRDPTWLNLVFNAVADFGEGFAHVVGHRVGGGKDLPAGFDLYGAVAAYGAYEFLNAPTSLVFDPVRDG
jgi:hypothetical protein